MPKLYLIKGRKRLCCIQDPESGSDSDSESELEEQDVTAMTPLNVTWALGNEIRSVVSRAGKTEEFSQIVAALKEACPQAKYGGFCEVPGGTAGGVQPDSETKNTGNDEEAQTDGSDEEEEGASGEEAKNYSVPSGKFELHSYVLGFVTQECFGFSVLDSSFSDYGSSLSDSTPNPCPFGRFVALFLALMLSFMLEYHTVISNISERIKIRDLYDKVRKDVQSFMECIRLGQRIQRGENYRNDSTPFKVNPIDGLVISVLAYQTMEADGTRSLGWNMPLVNRVSHNVAFFSHFFYEHALTLPLHTTADKKPPAAWVFDALHWTLLQRIRPALCRHLYVNVNDSFLYQSWMKILYGFSEEAARLYVVSIGARDGHTDTRRLKRGDVYSDAAWDIFIASVLEYLNGWLHETPYKCKDTKYYKMIMTLGNIRKRKTYLSYDNKNLPTETRAHLEAKAKARRAVLESIFLHTDPRQWTKKALEEIRNKWFLADLHEDSKHRQQNRRRRKKKRHKTTPSAAVST